MSWWQRVRRWLRREPSDLFALTNVVQTKVSDIEFGVYRREANRNNMTIAEWARSTLNKGVSPNTLKQLSDGHGGAEALDFAYRLLDEEDRLLEGTSGSFPILPLGPRRKTMDKILSGHPCFHLNAELPPNFTRNECQGTCASNDPGYRGRPCYWSSLAAKECGGYGPKHAMPAPHHTKSAH